MPQYIVIARDGTDSEALNRRLAAREAHLKNTDDHTAHFSMAAALLDENDRMNGSVMIADFPSREAFDAWLAAEPYVTGKVWQDITVLPCRIGTSFARKNSSFVRKS